MPITPDSIAAQLGALEREAGTLRWGGVSEALERWRSDVRALLFHLRNRFERPPIVAVIGGTGTGKSTIVNRICEASVSATSFRRTFTSGPVAVAVDASFLPQGWLGVEHRCI